MAYPWIIPLTYLIIPKLCLNYSWIVPKLFPDYSQLIPGISLDHIIPRLYLVIQELYLDFLCNPELSLDFPWIIPILSLFYISMNSSQYRFSRVIKSQLVQPQLNSKVGFDMKMTLHHHPPPPPPPTTTTQKQRQLSWVVTQSN